MRDSYDEINTLSTKKDLLQYIETRFTTTFVGALDSVEKHFFDLFNDTEWKEFWPILREEILNKGNAQKRLALKKLEEYNFSKQIPLGSTPLKERNYNR